MFRYRENPFIPDEIKAGDIIGFSGDSWISTLVNIATYGIPFWGLSHVGIMGRRGRWPPDALREHAT